MNFMQSISTCFGKYATFKGRASRSEFWWFMLFIMVMNVILGQVDSMIFEPNVMSTGNMMAADGSFQSFSFAWQPQPIAGIFILATILPNIAVSVRRLHDLGKSGWWWWIIFIPLIGFILLLVWYASKGTDGDNGHGADPLA